MARNLTFRPFALFLINALIINLFTPVFAAVPAWPSNPLTKTEKAITATWLANGNPDGTRYRMEVSLDNFETIISNEVVGLTATIDELKSNAMYKVRVQALTDLVSDFTPELSIGTLANIPGLPVLGDVFAPEKTALTVTWSANENIEGSMYRVMLYRDANRNELAGLVDTNNTFQRFAGLEPNRQYWAVVRAFNSFDPGYSPERDLGSAFTLPGTFALSSNLPPSNAVWYGASRLPVVFQTDAFSGPNAAYLRYRWEPNQPTIIWPADANQGDDTSQWTPEMGNLSINVVNNAPYYLHVKAYNGSGRSDAISEKVLGPFQIDVFPPNPDPARILNVTRALTSLTWHGTASISDLNGAGLPNNPYGWTLDDGTEVRNGNSVHTTNGLEANTLHVMKLKLYDRADTPNVTGVGEFTAATLQRSPTGVEIVSRTDNSVQVRVLGGAFPNLTVGQSGLQVRWQDGSDQFFSSYQQSDVFDIVNLNPNTSYEITARARNQEGVETDFSAPTIVITPGGSARVTADLIPYLPPADGGKYKAPRKIVFTDDGSKASGAVSYYKMVMTEFSREPGTVEFDQAARINSGTWESATFNESIEPYAHIRAYASDGTSVSNGYIRLGPWVIDADAPQDAGDATLVAEGTSQVTATAGTIADLGLAGLPAEPYSFDAGQTYTANKVWTRTGLSANTKYTADIVYRDSVGNVSAQPLHKEAVTDQNAPTSLVIKERADKRIVLTAQAAEGFPNLTGDASGASGIQFGQVRDDETVDWRPEVVKTVDAAYDMPAYNARYRFTARAQNAVGRVTAAAPFLTAFTLAAPPNVDVVQGSRQAWTNISTFKFRAVTLPDVSTYDNYRYAWVKSETYTFDGSEPMWLPASTEATLDLVATSTGKWYLHVRSLNMNGDATAPVTLGWFGYDVTSPEPQQPILEAPTVAATSIEWHANPTISDADAGLHTEPFIWKVDGGPEIPSHLANPKLNSLGLQPNTQHSVKLQIRDLLDNRSLETTQSAYTLAASPIALPSAAGLNTAQTTLSARFRDGGNPSGTPFVIDLANNEPFTPILTTNNLTSNGPPDGILTTEFTGLTANTRYYVQAKALNTDSVATPAALLGSAVTKPVAPVVVVSVNAENKQDPAQVNGIFPAGTRFYVNSSIPFGTGTAAFYRYMWNNSPANVQWSDLDPKMEPATPEVSTILSDEGMFWFHVAAYSEGMLSSENPPSAIVGPFQITVGQGSSPVIVFTDSTHDSITTTQAPANGNQFPLSSNPYGFQINDGDIVWKDVTTHTQSGLIANTVYTAKAYLRDSVGQISGPVLKTVVTMQVTPTQANATEIRENSIVLAAAGDFQNVGVEQSAFQFILRKGLDSTFGPWLPQPEWTAPNRPANTAYSVSVKARNRVERETNESIPIVYTTLAKVPTEANRQVTPDVAQHVINGYYRPGETFVFSNNAGWGEGSLRDYRVIVNNSATVENMADFANNAIAAAWILNTKFTKQLNDAGSYYFHFRSYNSADVGGPVYTFGPVHIDNQAPLPNPPTMVSVVPSEDKIVWTATPAQDVGGAGIQEASAYNFNSPNPGGWQGAVHTMLNLQPNTLHGIRLTLRDRIGNITTDVDAITGVLEQSIYTLAARPQIFTDYPQINNSQAVIKWDKKNNSNTTRYQVGYALNNTLTDATVIDAGVDVSEFTVPGLQLNTDYWFGVRAINGNDVMTEWHILGPKRTGSEITAPTIKTPVLVGTDNIVLEWTDVNPAGTTFEFLYNEGPELITSREPQSIGQDKTFTISNLIPNTQYTVGVRSRSSGNIVSGYGVTTVVTLADTPVFTSLTISNVSATGVWEAGRNPDGTKYEMRASLVETFDQPTDLKVFPTSPAGNVTGLVPDTFYYVGVRAINKADVPTSWVKLGEGHTGVQPPLEPYLISNLTENSFRLDWTDGGNPPTINYVIERSLDEFANVLDSHTGLDKFVAYETLPKNTLYYLRGKGVGAHSESPFVAMGDVSTLSAPPINGTLAAGLNTVDVTWEANGNPDGTEYFAHTADNDVFQQLRRWDNVTTLNTQFPDLPQNTRMWVRVFSVNKKGVESAPLVIGSVVTRAAKPANLSTIRAKWNAPQGNHVVITISASDNNPEHTQYAIFNTNTNKYLTGNPDGGVADEATWLTRADWNGTQATAGRAIHALLPPDTQYGYRLKARNLDNIETEFNDPQTVMTSPAKPSLTVSVPQPDNDYVLLQWVEQQATNFRAYVSKSNDPGTFVPYHYFQDSNFIPHIVPDGVDDIPSNLKQIRHDPEGGYPGSAAPLEFVSRTETSVRFKHKVVDNPTPADTHYYYLTALNQNLDESEPSEVRSAQVIPTIRHYVIYGSALGHTFNPAFEYLAPPTEESDVPNLGPNTKLMIRVKARTTDGNDGPSSEEIEEWSLANPPGAVTVTPGFDDSHHVYMNVSFLANGNPPHTRYAIKWIRPEGDRFLSGQGGTKGATFEEASWLTKERWDEGFNHTGIETSKTFTYEVYARNGDAISGPHIVTAASPRGSAQSLSFQPPTQLSGVGESQSAIKWSWIDNSSDEILFEVRELVSNVEQLRVSQHSSIPQSATGIMDVIEAGLAAANTPYRRIVRAGSSEGFSLPSNEAVAFTLAVSPQPYVHSTSHQVNVTSNELKIRFKNDLPFGQGTARYYRAKLTMEENYTFVGDEERWDVAGEIKEFNRDVNLQDSVWYLHVMSYNDQDTPSAAAKFGPYPLFRDILSPKVVSVEQDGAGGISGARPLSQLGRLIEGAGSGPVSTSDAPQTPQLDMSFEASVPWAPWVHRLYLNFDKRMDFATVSNQTVVLRAVQNNLSETLVDTEIYPLEFSYDDPNQRVGINFVQGILKPGYLYELTVTNQVTDVARNGVSPEFKYYFRTFLDPAQPNTLVTVDPQGQVTTRVAISPNALPQIGAVAGETDLNYAWGFDPSERNDAAGRQAALGGDFGEPLAERFLASFDTNLARTSGDLKNSALVTISFRDDNNDGIVDTGPGTPAAAAGSGAARIRVSTLALYRMEKGLFVKLPNSSIDVQNKTVSATTYRLGVIVLIGAASNDVSNTYAYPVPFVASRDQKIFFKNLPDAGEIKIYNVAGELVWSKTFDPTRVDPLEWDVVNKDGQKVGADVYLYQIHSGSNKKTGKIVIVR